MICEIAPAKINFTLEVLKRRNDGFHEIKSVMQTIDICDILTFWDNDWIHVFPEYCNLPLNDSLFSNDCFNYFNNNLVYKAASILKEETGYRGGAIIQLRKKIPSAAGLGGGSSDAAATLKGLNKLWKLNLSTDELAKVGAKIGSDIPFFIYGGTCLSRGWGEIIEKVKSIPQKWLAVVLLPLKIKNKTKKLYSHITSLNYSAGSYTDCFIENVNNNGHDGNSSFYKGQIYNKTDNFIFNVFEKVYNKAFEEFNSWAEKLNQLIRKPFHLSGSGPSIFYISDFLQEITEIVNKIESLDLVKYIARTVP